MISRLPRALRDWLHVAWPGLLQIAAVIVAAFIAGLIIKIVRGG